MDEQIHIIREAVVRLTQMLAGKGIQVTQCGISAYVKSDHTGRPFLVNLPYIPDNAKRDLIDAIQGFLDHEVAHILFTDFAVMGKAGSNGGLLNAVEDTRIEREMAKKFQGSALNLENTGKFFLDKYVTPRLAEARKAGDTNAEIASLMVPLIRAMSGQAIFKEFMKTNMGPIQDVYDKIKDLTPKLETIKSTTEALEMAKTISKRIKEEEQPENEEAPSPPIPMPKPKAKPPSSSKEKPDDTEEKNEDEKENDPNESKPDAEADDGSAGDGKGDDDSGEDSEDGVSASAPSDGDGDDEGDGDDDHFAEADGGSLTSGGKVDIAKSAAALWKAIDKETSNDYDKSVSAAITDSAAATAKEADYLIYTKDKDVVEKLHIGRDYKDTMLTTLEDKVNHMVGPLQKDLERAIASRSLSSYTAGHRSGRLHSANLARLALNDDRVFRRKHEATSKDVAVELVVDLSGSMQGEKITIASQAAYALASVLERIGIKSEVICFTTGEASADVSTLTAERIKIGRSFSRYESLYMPILKGFDERMTTEVRKRFAWVPNVDGMMNNNVDGESIEVAARRLLSRRESGKIMMVLSDGAPHCAGETRTLPAHLKRVIKDATKSGINVIGIGIDSHEVQKYYPKYLVLKNVADLPTVVMKELRALIIK
ncbi:hypothetical protein QN372_00010 [Undibacterium sp. RTI2.1]|uniref:cobaltochelatase CobT-related protein n=1 Tax=unclassified Undibacterium TaxID=2630295 RepID=UPI002AB5C824|nr:MULTISPECIES: hypothetical protein [unclassified Undibacterium]MDY7537523.1 hypothetical protein [Undibacterium sp. 5I1]MEB0029121.1 hypothetical protein [Undibacterium sp. RTI2.1]MEB0115429.1 hypothetical protein [Undibacterium sp. RTI2.2]MEB0232896.1 hypothetical protein [Undibacterium sp. 10I3]MEB0256258.1 hypothetical protein [Undibacterium sp. 5I1]